jgi:hypothetical protein
MFQETFIGQLAVNEKYSVVDIVNKHGGIANK